MYRFDGCNGRMFDLLVFAVCMTLLYVRRKWDMALAYVVLDRLVVVYVRRLIHMLCVVCILYMLLVLSTSWHRCSRLVRCWCVLWHPGALFAP